MQRLLLRTIIFLSLITFSVSTLHAQEDTSKPTSVDPSLLALENAKVPKEFTIAGITLTGVHYLDTSIVLSIANIQVGDKVLYPGGDLFSKAIQSLWRQKLFSDIQIYITKVQADNVWIEISVTERPRLGNFKFDGAKKSEVDELQGKVGLVKQTIITENMKRRAVEVITKYYADKGYKNIAVNITSEKDPSFVNSEMLTLHIDKGRKARIDDIFFAGNENVSSGKLKKQMKGTKEKTRLTLFPAKDKDPYGIDTAEKFSDYVKDWGFLTPSKTKTLLDPYFRFKLFSSAKLDMKKFGEDMEKVVTYYNSLGYRDAQIIDTAIISNKWRYHCRPKSSRRT